MASRWTRYHRTALLTVMVIAAGAASALGHGSIPHWVPITEIIKNVESRISEHPDDPEGYYILGRASALVFETKNSNVYMHLGEPASAGWQKNTQTFDKDKAPAVPSDKECQDYLTKAIKNLNKAIEIRPDVAKYRLALDSALESGVEFAGKIDVYPLCPVAGAEKAIANYRVKEVEQLGVDDRYEESLQRTMEGYNWEATPSFRDGIVTCLNESLSGKDEKKSQAARRLLIVDWKLQVDEQYFKAMCLAVPTEGKASEKPLWGSMEDWVSYEAATRYIQRVESRGAKENERLRLQVAKDIKKAFDELPHPSAITPIIFGLDHRNTLATLLSPNTPSPFDLDGTSRHLRWEWLKPTTAILVWDPNHTGRITSGRQLFGSVSWWLFFRNGYEALDALDDNRDGKLTGRELDGIAAWFDTNSNGISDPGEIIPLTNLQIASISCRATTITDGYPANPAGLTMTDGRTLPTYDWIASTVPDPPSQGAPTHNILALAGPAALIPFIPLAAARHRNPALRASGTPGTTTPVPAPTEPHP